VDDPLDVTDEVIRQQVFVHRDVDAAVAHLEYAFAHDVEPIGGGSLSEAASISSLSSRDDLIRAHPLLARAHERNIGFAAASHAHCTVIRQQANEDSWFGASSRCSVQLP
jgi:hypothetical protein